MDYNNTPIRSLYSPGFSFIMMSFYKTNLTLGFTPWVGQNHAGRSQYDKQKFLSTTIDPEKAAALYLASMSIIEGTENNQVRLTITCNNQATLLLEYKPNQNAQMRAYLTLDKKGRQISFEFGVHQFKTRENGQVLTKVIQSGLGVFAKTLEGYLTGVGADRHLSKLPEDDSDATQTDPWM